MLRIFLILFFWIMFFSCSFEKNETLFSKLSPDDTGIEFVNINQETERSNIITYEYFYNGGGVALGDINNDGLTDIYFTSNIFSNKLYLNQGGVRFKDITSQSNTGCEVGWKTGVSMVDINGDGLLDIYVCRSASPDPERRRNILLMNNGDLTFTEKGKEFNLDDPSYSTQSAFFDYDKDGDLDAVLLNHSLIELSGTYRLNIENTDVRHPHVGNKLLRNDGDHFTDISDSIGVHGSLFNYGLGLSLSDVNNDGWIDIYMGCDYTDRDRLLINKEGKYFEDVTKSQLSHISKFTMGSDIADINGDEQMDIFTLDMLPENNNRQKQSMGSDQYNVYADALKNGLHSQYMRNMLHLNNGNESFSEIGQLAGISNTDWSWGVLIQDYDNDGVQDIFVSNGYKRDLTDHDFGKYTFFQEMDEARKRGEDVSMLNLIERNMPKREAHNYMFRGNGDLTYANTTNEWGFKDPTLTNGIAYADLDNDGDLDLVTNNINEIAGIFKNNAQKLGNNFLQVKLQGDQKNLFAVGAKVSVYAKGKRLVKEQLPVRGFQSSVDYNLHFGLGKIEGIDSITVCWPEGGWTMIRSPEVNQLVTIKKDEVYTMDKLARKVPLFSRIDGTDIIHKENDFNDFNLQALLPHMYSTLGPGMAVGDVNGDGMADIFMGGAKNHPSRLYIQNNEGRYTISPNDSFTETLESEIIDAVLFDMDADGDLDLYMVTGGYEFQQNSEALADALYENDGYGNFVFRKLPAINQSGSCVRVADVDNDSDLDLFVGGRIVPERYPETPESVILINDGKGNFRGDNAFTNGIKNIGMVTDALWTDLNGDGLMDLIVVGEWMPLKVLINGPQGFTDQTTNYFNQSNEGFWNCIIADDFDGDGDVDLVAGNLGLNNQMRASSEQPVFLYYADYDNNGSLDPLLDYTVVDKNYPYASRDELMEQLPLFKKRFPDYRSYASATMQDVLTKEEQNISQILQVFELRSCLFKNNGNRFEKIPLPLQFQFAPIYAMVSVDINHDGHLDLITGGNLTATRARTGKLTGNFGISGYGDGKGNFTIIDVMETGLNMRGDIRKCVYREDKLIVAINNGPLEIYNFNKIAHR